MGAGRPREHDRELIAANLIEWAKKDDSINFNKFCAYCDPILPVAKLRQWAAEDDKFRTAYEQAKTFLAFRREEFVSNDRLHSAAWGRNAKHYDVSLKQDEEASEAYTASLRKDEDSKPTQINIKIDNDGLGSGLKVSAPKIST